MGWEGGGGLYWSKEALHQASGVGDRIEQEGVQKQDVAKGVCRGLRHWMVTERMRGGGGGENVLAPGPTGCQQPSAAQWRLWYSFLGTMCSAWPLVSSGAGWCYVHAWFSLCVYLG